MTNVFHVLLKVFGMLPWIERIFNLCINKKLLNEIIKIAFKLTGNTNLENALESISLNDDLKLEFQRELLKLEDAYWKEVFKDVQNARERDLTLRRMRGKNTRANIMLILALFGIIFSLCSLIFFRSYLTSEMIGIIAAVAGIFGACLKDAYAFEFGSSNRHKRYSNEKDDYFFRKKIATFQFNDIPIYNTGIINSINTPKNEIFIKK